MRKIEAFFENKDKIKENREEVKEADNNDDDNYSSSVAHKPSFSNEYGCAVAKLPIILIIYCPGSCSPHAVLKSELWHLAPSFSYFNPYRQSEDRDRRRHVVLHPLPHHELRQLPLVTRSHIAPKCV